MSRLALLAALAWVSACHRPPSPVADASTGPAISEPVQHLLHAMFALRDAAGDAGSEASANNPEVPWLRTHIAWDLITTVAASHGFAEAPMSTVLQLWPAALEEAARTDATPIASADSVRSLADTAGREPCVFRPPTVAESAFITEYLTFEPIPAGLDPAVGQQLAPYRALAAQADHFVVARCTRGERPVAIGSVMEQGASRLVPIVIRESRAPVR